MTTTDAKESQLDVDVEKNSPLGAYPIEKKNKKDGVCSYADDDDETGAAAAAAVPGAALVYGNTMYAKINRVADRFRIEARGIERVPDNERTDQGLMQVGTMWLAANMVVSSFAIGALAIPVFGLGFVDSLLAIFFFNVLGITPVSFYSTFGPRFGLRQMVLSRFVFGYYGVKIIAFFNILACVGWSAINVIVGAQLLHTVNNHLPGWAAIILIATATFLVALFGYKVVHGYEFYSWIPSFIIFLIVLVEFARSGHFLNVPMRAGSSEAGSVLSFAASVFGFATGWTSYAADYTVYQPVTSSRRKVFAWTFAGLLAPLCFTEMLGLAVSTAVMNVDVAPQYAAGFRDSGIGGLLGAVLLPPLGRFGEFCLVVLALSIVANNCPNIYSLALSLQVMDRHVEAVPRFIWTFIGTLVYCAIAIPGYGRFTDVLENFMLLISYWLAIYESICLTDHFLFKRGFGGYDLTIYRDPSRLPVGVAALVAFGLGVGGAVLGMAQQWFVGPVGKMVGDSGGDVGFLLAFGFAGVGYVGLRGVERRVLGR